MGIELPAVVPAGPNQPMGHHAHPPRRYGGESISLTAPMPISASVCRQLGCIRLRDNDIEALYNAISPGTKVNIIADQGVGRNRTVAVWLRSISRCLSISMMTPQTLPITQPREAREGVQTGAQTDGTVMERAMNS